MQSQREKGNVTYISLEKKVKECQLACDKDPSSKNLNELKILQTDYDRQHLSL